MWSYQFYDSSILIYLKIDPNCIHESILMPYFLQKLRLFWVLSFSGVILLVFKLKTSSFWIFLDPDFHSMFKIFDHEMVGISYYGN